MIMMHIFTILTHFDCDVNEGKVHRSEHAAAVSKEPRNLPLKFCEPGSFAISYYVSIFSPQVFATFILFLFFGDVRSDLKTRSSF